MFQLKNLFILSLLLLLISIFAYSQSIEFVEHIILDGDMYFGYPARLLEADMDGDGDNDIVTATYFCGMDTIPRLLWYENNADNTFSKHIIDENTYNYFALAVGDIDGDDDVDIVSNYGIFINNGYGDFFEDSIGVSVSLIYHFDIIDIDQDSDLDVFGYGYYETSWYENNGNGDFTEHMISTIDPPKHSSYADMDADGDIDIVLSGYGGLSWMENDGDFNFQEHSMSNYSDEDAFALADFDGDDDFDVFGRSSEIYGLSLFINNGSGEFNESIILPDMLGVTSCESLDFDSDGDFDLFYSTRLYGSNDEFRFSFLENEGDGVFTENGIIEGGYSHLNFILADVNNANNIDIISVFDGKRLSWMEINDELNLEEHFISRSSQYARAVAAADLDNDNDIDIITPKLAMINNNSSFEVVEIPYDISGSADIYLVDIDNDDNPDYLSGYGHKIITGFNLGNGIFTFSEITNWDDNFRKIAPTFFNNDNYPDIIFSIEEYDPYTGQYENWIRLYINNEGDIHGTSIFQHSVCEDLWCIAFNTADIDNDGDSDIIILDHNVCYYENLGNNSFEQHIYTGLYYGERCSIYAFDINSDGFKDILYTQGVAFVYLISDYEGNYTSYDTYLPVTNLTSADIDNNGIEELIAICPHKTSVLNLLDDNSIEEVTLFEYSRRAYGFEQIDMDNDQDIDFIVAHEYSQISWYENLLYTNINNKNHFFQPHRTSLTNHPNPFNPSTVISFELPRQEKVSLSIFNIKGQLVKKLINDETIEAGSHDIMWDGTGNNASSVASGVYFYRLESGGDVVSRKMLLLK